MARNLAPLKWKLSLAASLLLNAVFLALWLQAPNAQMVTPAAEIREVAIVVTATGQPTGEAQLSQASPTVESTATEPATLQPPTPTATSSPSPSPTPAPTETVAPTETPLPPPTATPTAIPTPSWLGYVNTFREQGGLPPVVEEFSWSLGSEAHSRYIVKTDFVGHSQDSSSPWYSRAGLDAARNGNIAATSWFEAPPEWAVDYWISAPFHALPLLDPQLRAVGFGWYREQDGGTVFAATMDILRGLDQEIFDVSFPIMYPRDGGVASVRQSFIKEYPNPRTSCPNHFVQTTGPPIILQMGAGAGRPRIDGSSFRLGDVALEHCIFGETTYVNPDQVAQQAGRRILDVRDAIVLIPHQTLIPGQTYTASITVHGQPVTWSFTAAPLP